MTSGPPPSRLPLGYESPPYRPAPRYAPLTRRAAAALIDGVILLPAGFGGMMALLTAAEAALAGAPGLRTAVMYYSMPLFVLGWFVLAWLYHAFCEGEPNELRPR